MSDEPTERDVEALADVLGEHWLAFRDGKNPYYCPCGEWVAVIAADGRDQNGVTIEMQHLAHLANVISDWYAERIAEARREGAAESVERAAWEVQRVINHWTSVPPDVLAERAPELTDLEACRDRIDALRGDHA